LSKFVSVFILGHSTAEGSGLINGYNNGRGSPIKDPQKPNGNRRSGFPAFAERLGTEGINCAVYNHAIGASTFTVSQLGFMIPWEANFSTRPGLYMQSDGAIWKNKVTWGTANIPLTTTPPVGTSDFTGADTLPWQYMRPITPADSWRVVPFGNPLFDPMGFMGKFLANVPGAIGKKVLILLIGSSDVSYPSLTTNDFRESVTTITQYALAAGIDEVYLTYTPVSQGRDMARNALFRDAMYSVLNDTFLNNLKVKKGVDFLSLWGEVKDTSNLLQIGLHDGLHLNDHSNDMMGQLWAENMLSNW